MSPQRKGLRLVENQLLLQWIKIEEEVGRNIVAKGDGEYIILIKGEVKTFTNWKDIPGSFENIIKFNPTPPPSPHNEEDHEYINTFDDKLHELMGREEE